MKILLAYDGSAYAQKALERAIHIASKEGAEMNVIYVLEDVCLPVAELSPAQCREATEAYRTEAGKTLAPVCDKLAACGIKTSTMLETGNPVDKIVEAAENLGSDLIVLGSKGKSLAKRIILGSVSAKVAEHAKCDVLIVK